MFSKIGYPGIHSSGRPAKASSKAHVFGRLNEEEDEVLRCGTRR